jgi:8-oxo-dGTP pyrophosphatase MutT (NUDIX family)
MENNLNNELQALIKDHFSGEIALQFTQRLTEGSLTKEENPQSHLCVYFAACDFTAKKVFIGHHIKSGEWLFNGGHIDQGESLHQAVTREIDEEWGTDLDQYRLNTPELLTITPIDNPTKQTCTLHFDVWFFVNLDLKTFTPDSNKLLKEFHEVSWMSINKAKELVTDPATLEALDYINSNYFEIER